MSSSESDHPLSTDSERPASSLTSSRSASSLSIVSSVDDDYFSCLDDNNSAASSPFEEIFFSDAELPEACFPTGDDNYDADEFPTTVLIYSLSSSPVASPSFSPQPFKPSLVDQATQSSEDDIQRLSEWATVVNWDPRVPDSFPPGLQTCILPPWWRSDECHGTFGYPAYARLEKPFSYAGRFPDGDPRSDDMEGR
ncbi:MAG: hypothetical protein GY847_30925, partial [Proteobacteria bacterium]|nr:hypothetical protein [Pseudomonadota bacterium]